jgi:glyoxylase-like metal-dependent hydrolase (beta-lactamase superfamily II)
MTDFTILAEGYVRRKQGMLYASSTVVLVHDSGHTIIVDPGLDLKLLRHALEKWEVSTDDVDYVVLTHTHPDHTLLAGIFHNAKTINSRYIYSLDGQLQETGDHLPGTEIEILFTPGHDITDCSLVMKTLEYGRVAIVGDVFWWHDGENQESSIQELVEREDTYAFDMKILRQSRKSILEYTDRIIPGHGKMFHVPR